MLMWRRQSSRRMPNQRLLGILAPLEPQSRVVGHTKMKKTGCLKCLFGFIAFLLCFAAGAWALINWISWSPGAFNDGPFHGRPRGEAPTRPPDQVFPLYHRFSLEVYNAMTNEPAPTVLLRDGNTKIKWCIYAIADDMTNTVVKTIHFRTWRHYPFKEPRVRGLVCWTYGHEGTWWFISREGDLKEYWYSW